MLSLRGIAVDPSKVTDVLECETPQTVKEVRSFLGLAGYYRRFIENFSKIAKPLTSLLEKMWLSFGLMSVRGPLMS